MKVFTTLLLLLVSGMYAQESVMFSEGAEKESWMLYPYRPGQVYEIIVETAFITTLELASDETEVKEPALGEGTMFSLAQGSGYDAQNRPIIVLYIKPQMQNVATNAVITTNRRQYHLLLRESRDEGHMFRVRWIYPDGMIEGADFSEGPGDSPPSGSIGVVDVQQLHFNYAVRSITRKRDGYDWAPYLVFDDRIRTYIAFGAADITETPIVFSITQKQALALTFQVSGNYYLIPGVHKELELRLPGKRKNQQEVVRIIRGGR